MRQLVRSGLYYGIYEVLWRGERSRTGLRRVLKGGILLLLGVLVAFLGFLGLVTSLFFGLAEVQGWVQPALITTGIIWLTALLLFYQGWHKIRR